MAGRRRAAQPRWLADHDCDAQGHRPGPTRAHPPRQAEEGGNAARSGVVRAARHRRRPPPAHLHLLSSGVVHGSARGSDATHGRRLDGAGDRSRLPRAGVGNGATDHPSEDEDQAGSHPVSASEGAGPSSAHLWCAGRPVSRVQRGVPRDRPRNRTSPPGSDDRGDPAHSTGARPPPGGRGGRWVCWR